MAEFGNFLQAKFTLIMTPLPDLHFTPHYSYDLPKGNRSYSYLMMLAGLFILLIALLNYRNLLSASMAARSRSLGVFKINGASRSHLYELLCDRIHDDYPEHPFSWPGSFFQGLKLTSKTGLTGPFLVRDFKQVVSCFLCLWLLDR